MEFNGHGCLVSKRNFTSKAGKEYYFIKVIDDKGNEFEMMSNGDVLGFKQFAPCNFTVKITQGKYPRFELISLYLIEG